MWFIDLLGLLYHTKVDRKGILAGTILSAAHAQNLLLLLLLLLLIITSDLQPSTAIANQLPGQ